MNFCSLNKQISIALYEPEIHRNVGSVIRTAACFNLELSIIEPIGFCFSDKQLKRAQLDYNTTIHRFNSMELFFNYTKKHNKEIILFTPHSEITIDNITIEQSKSYVLLFGRESNGVEPEIAKYRPWILSLAMANNVRSFSLPCSVIAAVHHIALLSSKYSSSSS